VSFSKPHPQDSFTRTNRHDRGQVLYATVSFSRLCAFHPLPPRHVVFILLAALRVYVIISGLYVYDLFASQGLASCLSHIHSPFVASLPSLSSLCCFRQSLISLILLSPSDRFSSVFCASFSHSLPFDSPPLWLRREGVQITFLKSLSV